MECDGMKSKRKKRVRIHNITPLSDLKSARLQLSPSPYSSMSTSSLTCSSSSMGGQRWPTSAGAALLARQAVDLFMPGVVAETLTAPCRHILLLLECLLYCATPSRYLDLQSLEETLVEPVRVTSAPVALLRPLPLWTAPPFVVGAVALPAEAGVWGVVKP